MLVRGRLQLYISDLCRKINCPLKNLEDIISTLVAFARTQAELLWTLQERSLSFSRRYKA